MFAPIGRLTYFVTLLFVKLLCFGGAAYVYQNYGTEGNSKNLFAGLIVTGVILVICLIFKRAKDIYGTGVMGLLHLLVILSPAVVTLFHQEQVYVTIAGTLSFISYAVLLLAPGKK